MLPAPEQEPLPGQQQRNLKRANANSFALLAEEEEDEDDVEEGTPPDTAGSAASDSDASGAGTSGAAAPKRVALTDADRMDHDADGGSFEQPIRRAAPAEPRRGTPGFGRPAAAKHAKEDRIDPAGSSRRSFTRVVALWEAERVEREAAEARRAAQRAAERAAERTAERAAEQAAGGWTAADGEDLPGGDSEPPVPQEPAEPPDRGPAPASAAPSELLLSEATGTSLELRLPPVSRSTSG